MILTLALVFALALTLTACSSECAICGDSGDTHKVEGTTVCKDFSACIERAAGELDFEDVLGDLDDNMEDN